MGKWIEKGNEEFLKHYSHCRSLEEIVVTSRERRRWNQTKNCDGSIRRWEQAKENAKEHQGSMRCGLETMVPALVWRKSLPLHGALLEDA